MRDVDDTSSGGSCDRTEDQVPEESLLLDDGLATTAGERGLEGSSIRRTGVATRKIFALNDNQ